MGDRVIIGCLQKDESELIEAIEKSKVAFRDGNFKEVSLSRANYEASRRNPSGMVMSGDIHDWWKKYDTTKDEIILGYITAKTPKLAIKKGWGKLPDIRFVAGMSWIWGNALEARIICCEEIRLASLLFYSYALFLYDKENYKNIGIEFVNIQTCNDKYVCDPCKKLTGKRIKLDDVPELPFGYCECETGCRCWMNAA